MLHVQPQLAVKDQEFSELEIQGELFKVKSTGRASLAQATLSVRPTTTSRNSAASLHWRNVAAQHRKGDQSYVADQLEQRLAEPFEATSREQSVDAFFSPVPSHPSAANHNSVRGLDMPLISRIGGRCQAVKHWAVVEAAQNSH